MFIRYQHVEKLESASSKGLLDGTCHVFPKMDGANMCAYSEYGNVYTMSRNRTLDEGEPFAKFVASHEGIQRFLRDFPGIRLYGEWMVPHTVKTYVPEVWNRWFVFDMYTEERDAVYDVDGIHLEVDGRPYIPYEEYAPILDRYGIEYVPLIRVIDNPNTQELMKIADEESSWMMAEGPGEGIVVKRYDFVNMFGRINWAKVLSARFSTYKMVSRACRYEEKGEVPVEHEIAIHFVTPDLVNKEYAKITESCDDERSYPGRLLSTVWYCLLTECMYDAVKKYGKPTVDFNRLKRECDMMTKMLRPEVFGLRALEVY